MEHCDFVPLRNMLIRTHLQDLKEVTNNVHYENYRCRKLAGVAGGSTDKIPNKVRKTTQKCVSQVSQSSSTHFFFNLFKKKLNLFFFQFFPHFFSESNGTN